MADKIPSYSSIEAPMREFIEKALAKSGKRTKSSVKKYTLDSLGWTDEDDGHFDALRDAISNSIQLSYFDPSLAA